MTALEDFARIAAKHERCFWLDGGGSQSWSGSRSIVGRLEDDDVSLVYDRVAGTVVELPAGRVVGDDVFAALQERLDGDPATHWVGYFGYAARTDLPARSMPGVPDAIWMRARDVQVHEGPATAIGIQVEADEVAVPDWYATSFRRVQEQLRAGNSYEVNLTYRDLQDSDRDPVAIYTSLRSTNPAPYAGVLRHGDTWLLSASPERFATIDRHRQLEARPIKGTTRRGSDAVEDERLRDLLATDPKFRAENLRITDLLRTALSQVCVPGTVTVPQLMEVESYASVHADLRQVVAQQVGDHQVLRPVAQRLVA